MNTSAKGWKKERECRVLLEKQGWQCVFKSIRWRYGTLDFARLFDSVFVKFEVENAEPTRKWLFVSNKHFQGYHLQHQQEIKTFKEQFGLEGMQYQLWIWVSPRWTGRQPNKVWNIAKWQVIEL